LILFNNQTIFGNKSCVDYSINKAQEISSFNLNQQETNMLMKTLAMTIFVYS